MYKKYSVHLHVKTKKGSLFSISLTLVKVSLKREYSSVVLTGAAVLVGNGGVGGGGGGCGVVALAGGLTTTGVGAAGLSCGVVGRGAMDAVVSAVSLAAKLWLVVGVVVTVLLARLDVIMAVV